MKRFKLLSLIVVFAALFVGLGTISSQAQVTFEHYKTLKGNSSGITTLSFSPDGRYLASGSWDLTVTLWDVNSGQKIKTVQGGDLNNDQITQIEWEKNGNRFTSKSMSGYYIVWEVNTWKKIEEDFGENCFVFNMIVTSNDGKYLAGRGENNGEVIIRSTSNKATIQKLRGHSERVDAVQFSEDGKYLASGSADGTIIIWKQKEVNNEPSAKIDKVWVEHNVQRTGIQQVYDYYWNRYIDTPYTYNVMRIHVNFVVNNKLNEKIWVCAFFFDEDGNRLTSSNNEYKTPSGKLTVQDTGSPRYKNSRWEDFVLEIPYSVIKKGSNKFHIKIIDSDDNNLATSEYIHFTVY